MYKPAWLTNGAFICTSSNFLEEMLGSEGNNTRKIKSGKVGLATLAEGTETTSDRHLVTRNLPDSSTFFVKITLDPLVTNPNPFYKNFAVPNPLVTSQTRIMPCFLTSNDPVSAFSSKQIHMSSNVGVICSIHGNSGFLRLEDTRKPPDEYSCATTRHGPIFEVVNMFINDCILEFLPPSLPGRNVNSSSSSAKYLENYKFLEYCYDCNKALDGNDIYMYSDKSFCSNECREKEFLNDSNSKKAEKNV